MKKRKARSTAKGRRMRRRRLTRHRWHLVAVGVLALASTLLALSLVYPRLPGPGSGRRVTVDMPANASIVQAAARLAEAGVIRSAPLWSLYARLRGAHGRLRSGRLVLSDALSPASVLRRVAIGYGPSEVWVTIPEGWNRFEIARLLEARQVTEAEQFTAATTRRSLLSDLGLDAESAEGYLFPDTYAFREQTPASEVVRRLVDTWTRRTTPLLERHAETLSRLRREFGWGTREVLTLASIVEEEAATPEERPLIAGVFLNRMRSESFRPRRLDSDPTVFYGCLLYADAAPSCASRRGRKLTTAMLRDAANPYNTRVHEGLPPGPIANPGLDALRAVLEPASHDYLYFVSKRNGRHHFSSTLSAHQEAVEKYMLEGTR